MTGFEDERGEGEGYGYNINMPMPHGSTGEQFFNKLDEALSAVRLFQPDALVHVLGFDIYQKDVQAQVAVTTEGFRRLGDRIRLASLPTLVVQEGGYALEALSMNVQQYLTGLNA